MHTGDLDDSTALQSWTAAQTQTHTQTHHQQECQKYTDKLCISVYYTPCSTCMLTQIIKHEQTIKNVHMHTILYRSRRQGKILAI